MADPTSPSPYSENKRFEPKTKVELQAPKDDLISVEELAAHDGRGPSGSALLCSALLPRREEIPRLRHMEIDISSNCRLESGQTSIRRDQGHHL